MPYSPNSPKLPINRNAEALENIFSFQAQKPLPDDTSPEISAIVQDHQRLDEDRQIMHEAIHADPITKRQMVARAIAEALDGRAIVHDAQPPASHVSITGYDKEVIGGTPPKKVSHESLNPVSRTRRSDRVAKALSRTPHENTLKPTTRSEKRIARRLTYRMEKIRDAQRSQRWLSDSASNRRSHLGGPERRRHRQVERQIRQLGNRERRHQRAFDKIARSDDLVSKVHDTRSRVRTKIRPRR